MERPYIGDKKSRMDAVFREQVVAKTDDLIDRLDAPNGTKVARIIEMDPTSEPLRQMKNH